MTIKNYIGLACTGHDNAIAIINSKGEVVFAEASERYLQNKRAINSPPDDMIRIEELINTHCEDNAELVVCRTWSDQHKQIFTDETDRANKRELEYKDAATPFITDNAKVYQYVMTFVINNVANTGNHLLFRSNTSLERKVNFKNFDHHLTHAATACFTSPLDTALCVVVDGFGEGTSTGIYQYKNNKIKTLHKSKMLGNIEQSLGVFYGTLCGLCGFDIWRGEEWKVMGLAPYGKFDPNIYQLMEQRFKVSGLDFECPTNGDDALPELLSHARSIDEDAISVADLAFTGQQFFCDKLTELLCNAYEHFPSDNLILAGGCALNSAYNGKITEKTPFKHLHVYSAPGDDGNALGAAYLGYNQDNSKSVQHSQLTPYLGSTIKKETLDNICKYSELPYLSLDLQLLPKIAAQLLTKQQILGWIQGRAEFGPRALGNRSILADPRSPTMKDKINARVKFREEFRPFAPSILHEYGDEYFHNYQDAPYMERTLQFKDPALHKVPAVVHVDGTGRLQSVTKERNTEYYNLIQEFFQLTGIPLLLNTSFNVMGKPIIHTAEDALAVFHTSGLDVLIINNLIFAKTQKQLIEITKFVEEKDVALI